MKRLATSLISDTKRFPFKKGTLEFLQDAHKETIAHLLIGLIGDTFNGLSFYAVHGVVNSGSGLAYSINAGYIFYLGELYEVESTSFTASAGQVAVLQFATAQFGTNADPVTFTDSTINNVHDIRRIAVVAGASGSGIKNFSDIVRLDLTKEAMQALLQGQIDAIKAAWAVDNDVTHWEADSSTYQRPTAAFVRSKVVGKTLSVNFTVSKTTNNGTALAFRYVFPTGATTGVWGDNSYLLLPCIIENNSGGGIIAAVLEIGTFSGVFRMNINTLAQTAFGNTQAMKISGSFVINID